MTANVPPVPAGTTMAVEDVEFSVAEPVQDSLLREIDEELRQEHYAKLWKRYGKYVIAAAVGLVVAVAGHQLWRDYQAKTRMAEGERFAEAQRLVRAEQPGAAGQILARLAEEAGDGYALLARFQIAALRARLGDRAGAAVAYREAAADAGIDAVYRDLAVIMATLQEIDVADPAMLTQRLAPLTVENNPWRHSAREITALLAHRAGDREAARQLLSRLANDAAAPLGIRERASEMLAAVGE